MTMVLVYGMTFLSGFAALVYQILWTRQLTLVLGTTTASISMVVAAFMGGLALGSAVFGRWVDLRRRFLMIYALLEVGIGLSAVMVMMAIPQFEASYPHIVAIIGSHTGLLAFLRFIMTFGLLLIPTSLMGGTFPVLTKAILQSIQSIGITVGRLYAANTIGAVTGCAAAGIILLGAMGIRGSNYLAIAVNLAAAFIAIILYGLVRRPPVRKSEAAAAERRDGLPSMDGISPSRDRRAVLPAIAISGCLALGYEIVWSRALAIVLGHSIYAFTFVLSTYLAGLAIGGWLVSPMLDRLRRPAHYFVIGQLALAVVTGMTLLLIPFLPFSEYVPHMSPLKYVAKNLVCTVTLLFLPTVLLGAILPLAIRIYASSLREAGKHVGTVYAWNTIGSIAGSLLAGFILIPCLGTQPTFFLLVTGNLLLALVMGVRTGLGNSWRVAVGVLVFAGALILLNSGDSPILRQKAVDRVEHALGGQKIEVLYYDEDEVASVGLSREPSGLMRLFTNGTLMTHYGMETMWMGHLPLAVVKDPRQVLVLCLGMGNTFISASRYPVRVEAVELSPKVVEAFYILHSNGRKLDDDRILVGDARHTVLISSRKYDVITVDPPPPLYSAGTVNFHTVEFYRLCKQRILPSGVVCQWIPFRHCTVEEFKILLKTFRHVFDRMWVWAPSPETGLAASGMYLLGLGPEVTTDLEMIRERLMAPRVEADVRRFSTAPLMRLLPVPVMSGEDVDRFCGSAPIMDDQHPYLEFPLLRNRGQGALMTWGHLKQFLASP